MTENYFKELSQIDVSNHLEKKGKFNYLSWAFAVKALREYDPTATWEVVRFDGLPYLKSDVGYFVEVNVTIKGITLGQIHPVLNNYNKPIEKPTSFDINTSIQRCLVKAIALHGLGIWVYAGEDLPIVEGEGSQEPEQSRKHLLIAKWVTLGGAEDQFNVWYQGQVSKGYNERQMEQYLTKKLMDKQKGA